MARRFKNTARSARPKSVLVLLGVVGLVAAVGIAVLATGAFAATTPPTPTINAASEPTNPTKQTSASFGFSDTQAGVTFQCSLDGARFTACASPQPYSGLAAGSHQFQVEAVANNKASSAASYSWTIDLTHPTVSSIALASGATNPTHAGPLSWTVTFSEPVNNVGSGNFGLATSAGITGTPVVGSVTAVGGSPSATWTVSAATGGVIGANGSTIGLNLTSPGTIQDPAGNSLSVSGPLPMVGQAYGYDTTAPSVSIVLAGSSPTFAASVSWKVTFSENVTGVTTSAFGLSNSGLSGTPLVTGVSGSGAVYTVTAATGTGNGTLALQIPGAGSITDLAGNALTASTFPVTGPAYTFVPQPYSLFAGDASCSDAGISVGGKYNVFWAAHSNGAFTLQGSYNTFGTSDAGCTPTVAGKGNAFGRNSAAAPTAGPNNLPYPQTFDQTNVCSQPSAHHGATFTIANGSSGIYCATSSITFASSNITATVTLVAPSIQMNGSGLDLTPAYGNLIAFNTNTTVGNTGLTLALSGGNDTFHNGTLYDPYGALTVGGSGSNFDGFFEAYTISISGSNNTFTGEGPASYLSVMGDVNPVWPGGGAVAIPLTFTNSNGNDEMVTSLDVSIVSSSLPGGCNLSDFTIAPSNVGPTKPLTVPANSSVTLGATPVQGVTAPTITYADLGDQTTCEGAKFTLSYLATDTNGSDTGTVSVGQPSPWTVAFGAASGGVLLPTSLTDANRTVDTVPVTVTNNDAGDEYLHQIVFAITPGWSACAGGGTNHSGTCLGGSANGDPACVANDFSLNSATPGAASTVTFNQEIGPNGHVTTSFTIQMIDNGHNQDACVGAHVSIRAVASS